jgi:hypothetical protein
MSAIDHLNQERLHLLNCKHGGGGFSADEERRLDEATARVCLLLPRILQSDWHSVDDISGRLDEIQGSIQKVREKYGLSG